MSWFWVTAIGRDRPGIVVELATALAEQGGNIEDASIGDGFRTAADRLWHVHIADSNRCFPGSGHIDFDGVFEALEEIGYTGYVSGEMLPLPDPDIAAQRTADFLRNRGVHAGLA